MLSFNDVLRKDFDEQLQQKKGTRINKDRDMMMKESPSEISVFGAVSTNEPVNNTATVVSVYIDTDDEDGDGVYKSIPQ